MLHKINNKKITFSALLLMVFCMLTACKKDDASNKDSAKPNKSTQISIVKVSSKTLEITEETVGTLESIIDPTVSAEIAARVLKVLVHPGQTVKKGQTIALLDATDFGLQRQEAQAEVGRINALITNQQKLVERNRALVDKNFISKNALDDASAQLDALKQQLVGAQSRINSISHNGAKNLVVAPADGIIETQVVSNGDFVRIGDPIVKIVSKKLLRAHLPFPERIAAKLQPGLTVKLTTPTSDKEIVTVVRELKPQITENNRSIDVTADIKDAIDWQPGASVNGKVILGSRATALVIPEQSVVLRPAGEVVYEIAQDKAQQWIALQRIVKTGLAENGGVEILEGLHGGETIAVDGAAFLTDKTPVNISK